MANFKIHERMPTVDEHQILWESVGWGIIHKETSSQSLAHSLYGVVATVDGEPVGMGRIVGDNYMYFYIQDVAIHPTYQGTGLGKEIMERLLAYIKQRRNGGVAFVGLFSAEGKDGFYEKLGFQNHAPHMTGMFTVFEG